MRRASVFVALIVLAFGVVTAQAQDSAWTEIAMPGHDGMRTCHACAWDPVHDMVYMYGGSTDGIAGGRIYKCLDRYDPVRDTWEQMADMLVQNWLFKGLYCHGKLYAMGGLDGLGYHCEAYDIATNTWSWIADMPYSNAGYVGVVWRDSLIYIIGGYGFRNRRINSTVVYDAYSGRWWYGSYAPDTYIFNDGCVVGDTIYVAGAEYKPWLFKGAIDPQNPLQIEWTIGPPVPCSTRFLGPTIALRDKVYFFGGWIGDQVNGSPTRQGWVYDPKTGAFDTLPLLPSRVGQGTVYSCFGVARETAGEIYKLCGADYISRNNWGSSYYRLCVDTPFVAVQERKAPPVSRFMPAVSLIRGTLYLTPAAGDGRARSGELLDITGQTVMRLRPGPNDVGGVAPGVYFVRESLKPKLQTQTVRKVTLTR